MSFAADSPLVEAVLASPNRGVRAAGGLDMLILHYTGMPTAQGALDRLPGAHGARTNLTRQSLTLTLDETRTSRSTL